MSNLKARNSAKIAEYCAEMLFYPRNNQALASIGRPAVLHCTVHMSHDVHVRVLHGDNSGIPGGDAETRD